MLSINEEIPDWFAVYISELMNKEMVQILIESIPKFLDFNQVTPGVRKLSEDNGQVYDFASKQFRELCKADFGR